MFKMAMLFIVIINAVKIFGQNPFNLTGEQYLTIAKRLAKSNPSKGVGGVPVSITASAAPLSNYDGAKITATLRSFGEYFRYDGRYLYALISDRTHLYQVQSADVRSQVWTGTSNGTSGKLYLDLKVIGQNYSNNPANMGLRISLTAKVTGKAIKSIAIEDFLEALNGLVATKKGIIAPKSTLLGNMISSWSAAAAWYTNGLTSNQGNIATASLTAAATSVTLQPTEAIFQLTVSQLINPRGVVFTSWPVMELDAYVGGKPANNLSLRFRSTSDIIVVGADTNSNISFSQGNQLPTDQLVGILQKIGMIRTQKGSATIESIPPLKTTLNAVLLNGVPVFLNSILKIAQAKQNALLEDGEAITPAYVPNLPKYFGEPIANNVEDGTRVYPYYFGAVGGPVGAKNFRINKIQSFTSDLNLIGTWDDTNSTVATFSCKLASNFDQSDASSSGINYVDATHDFAPAANVTDESSYFPAIDGKVEVLYPLDSAAQIPAAAVFRFLTEDKQAAILLYAPQGISLGDSNTTASGANYCAGWVAQTLSQGILSVDAGQAFSASTASIPMMTLSQLNA